MANVRRKNKKSPKKKSKLGKPLAKITNKTNPKKHKKKAISNVAGYNHRIYRFQNQDGKWESYEKWKSTLGRRNNDLKPPKKYVDSIVHRFQRVIGFSHGDEEEYEDDENLQEFREQMLQIPSLPKSEVNRVLCQALFESWVLSTTIRTNPYRRFLEEISNPNPKYPKIVSYMPPTDLLIQGYILYMSNEKNKLTGSHYGRGNVYNSIRTRIAGVSGTCKELGGGKLEIRYDTQHLLKKLQGKFHIHI